jgi:hypothetical protein
MTDVDEFGANGLFGSRGIRQEVGDAEHFFPYDHETCDGHISNWVDWPCWKVVRDVGEAKYRDLAEGMQKTIAYRIMQAPGILFVRHAVDGEDSVLPEMRPDWPVLTGKISWHVHPEEVVAPSRAWQAHVAKTKTGRDRDKVTGRKLKSALGGMAALVDWIQTRYPDKTPVLLSKSGNPIIVSHDGENLSEYHGHRRVAKYLFSEQPSEETEWSHDHRVDFPKAEVRGKGGEIGKGGRKDERGHLKDEHITKRRVRGSGADVMVRNYVPMPVEGWDRMSPMEQVAVTRTTTHTHASKVKDETVPLAARLDIHGKSRELLEAIEGTGDGEVWVAMESCLKSGAILQAILDEKPPRRAAVVSYPSVTLFPPEMGRFARRLRGLHVYLVPDSDYRYIQQVRSQAFFAREELRGWLGKDQVHIAAPPFEGFDEGGNPIKTGADDALGRYRRTLDEFEVIDRDPPLGYAELKWSRTERRKVGDYRIGDASQSAIFRWLVLCADDDGETHIGSGTLARHAFPEQWADAEEKDRGRGYNPLHRSHEFQTERDKVKSRVRQNLRAMKLDRMVEEVGEDVMLDGDGNPVEVNGVPAKFKSYRIPADIWEQFRGTTYTVAEAKKRRTSTL